MKLTKEEQARFDVLVKKENAGTLTEQERVELQALEDKQANK